MMHKPSSWNGIPIPYGRPVEKLRSTIEGGPLEKKWASFRALAADSSAESLDLLAAQAGKPDPHTRRAAIEAIGLNSGGVSLAHAIRDGLSDESAPVVRTACAAAAELKLIELRARVLELAESTDPHTQASSLRAITVLWQPDCFEAVFRVFSGRSSDDVRKQAGFALQDNADAGTWERLFDAWQSDPVPRHRTWACELAAKFGAGERASQLEKLSQDVDGHVRKAAMRALGAARNAD